MALESKPNGQSTGLAIPSISRKKFIKGASGMLVGIAVSVIWRPGSAEASEGMTVG
jgi:hypothetical protein